VAREASATREILSFTASYIPSPKMISALNFDFCSTVSQCIKTAIVPK
jgi:hypothetical protein